LCLLPAQTLKALTQFCLGQLEGGRDAASDCADQRRQARADAGIDPTACSL
jgi:hypothetical protein